jgi:hypothetical protein
MRPQRPLVLEPQPLSRRLRFRMLRVREPLTTPQPQTTLRRVIEDVVHGQAGRVAEHVRALKLWQDDDPRELRLRVLNGRVGVAERPGEFVLAFRGKVGVGAGRSGVDGVGEERLNDEWGGGGRATGHVE